jgi:hypothetical protein
MAVILALVVQSGEIADTGWRTRRASAAASEACVAVFMGGRDKPDHDVLQ